MKIYGRIVHVQKLPGCWINSTKRRRYCIDNHFDPFWKKHTHTRTRARTGHNFFCRTCSVAYVHGHVWQESNVDHSTNCERLLNGKYSFTKDDGPAPMIKKLLLKCIAWFSFFACYLHDGCYIFEHQKFILISVPVMDTVNLAAHPTGGLFYSTCLYIFRVKHIPLALSLLFFGF